MQTRNDPRLQDDKFREGFFFGLQICGMLEEYLEAQWQDIQNLRKQIARADDEKLEISRCHSAVTEAYAPCASCGEKTEIDYELDYFSPETHYCGRTERCCP